MANRINRLKVVLAEKKRQEDGLQNKWDETDQPFQNGVLIVANQRLLPLWRLQNCKRYI